MTVSNIGDDQANIYILNSIVGKQKTVLYLNCNDPGPMPIPNLIAEKEWSTRY